MKTFSKEVREAVFNAQNGMCCCCKKCTEPIESFHHIIPNTKTNNKLFPLFLHSPMNCVGMSNTHHTQRASWVKMNINRAYMIEKYLSEFI